MMNRHPCRDSDFIMTCFTQNLLYAKKLSIYASGQLSARHCLLCSCSFAPPRIAL